MFISARGRKVTFAELLRAEFLPYGELTGQQLGQLENHYDLLVRWNKRMNLTRIEKLEDAVRYHYAESLWLGSKISSGVKSVIDVGSGPGFPGIPVAILRPELQVTLLESNQRKAGFLREATIDLPNVHVQCSRLQDLPAGTQFDLVIARAVTPTEVLAANLSTYWMLLVSASDVPPGSESTKSPWGDERVLAVPRGTL